MNFYNDIDDYCCFWLGELMTKNQLIPCGHVYSGSIKDLGSTDLTKYSQAHFFAGLGGWPRALDLAGFPRSRRVWTGSCPCQPFSVVGGNLGFDDKRHLWPDWFALIRKLTPELIFGEQVDSPDGRRWLDLVCDNMESLDYAVGAAVLSAAGAGAPHGRHRIFFVAYPASAGLSKREALARKVERVRKGYARYEFAGSGISEGSFSDAGIQSGRSVKTRDISIEKDGAILTRLHTGFSDTDREPSLGASESRREHNRWAIEPGMGRVANGVSARVDKLRALGNAIVPQVAAQFVRACLELGI